MEQFNQAMSIIANIGIVLSLIAAGVWAVFQGGAFVGAIIALKNDVPALRAELAALQLGQQRIMESQDRQQHEMTALKKKVRRLWLDMGDLRRRQLGQGQTHVDLAPPAHDEPYDDGVLDDLSDDEDDPA